MKHLLISIHEYLVKHENVHVLRRLLNATVFVTCHHEYLVKHENVHVLRRLLNATVFVTSDPSGGLKRPRQKAKNRLRFCRVPSRTIPNNRSRPPPRSH